MCDQSFFADTIASLREAGDKLGTVMREVATKDAQIAIRDAEVKHLKHKVARAEAHSKALRDQINDELSHHARYNAVKAEVKDFLDEGARSKLLAQARARAERLLAGFLKDQEAKYEEFDEKVQSSDAAHAKKQAALRKELAAQAKAAAPDEARSESDDEGAPHPGTLGIKAAKAAKPEPKPKASPKPEAKPASGAKGAKPAIAKKKDGKAAPKAKDEKPKRKGVTMPRARFIKEMTPMYNKEKDVATAKAKEARKEDFKFPSLFEWITEPWRNLDPAVKKRKYQVRTVDSNPARPHTTAHDAPPFAATGSVRATPTAKARHGRGPRKGATAASLAWVPLTGRTLPHIHTLGNPKGARPVPETHSVPGRGLR
jgi:hypothetical protein